MKRPRETPLSGTGTSQQSQPNQVEIPRPHIVFPWHILQLLLTHILFSFIEFENLNYQLPRWNHPDIDWGLMSKFKTQVLNILCRLLSKYIILNHAPNQCTQKEVYAKEMKWEQDCNQTISLHKEKMTKLREDEERIKRESMSLEKKYYIFVQ